MPFWVGQSQISWYLASFLINCVAFLTHRSGIDKQLLNLIRAGIANRLNAYVWERILQELHSLRYDLVRAAYCYAIRDLSTSLFSSPQRFSSFHDPHGYAGFCPSKNYITSVYTDYMLKIRPSLDQVMSSLPGYVLKWDHTFKVC